MSTSSRIACLMIPDFPIAAHLRAEGDRSSPLLWDAGSLGAAIVVRGEGARKQVAAASEMARRRGIELEMRAADARGLCSELREWSWTPFLYNEAQTELVAALIAASPRVGRVGRAGRAGLGAFWLDAGGWDRLGGEQAFVEAAGSAALAAGYPETRIGIADTAVAARAATQLRGRKICRVPPGGDARFLAPLPIDVIPISDELLELLGALGLEKIGELSGLEPAEVEARLGAEGLQAHRWARGLDDGREGLGSGPSASEWTVEVELPGPAETLEPLLFLLKSCLDHLSNALAAAGLCIRALRCTIETEDGPAEKTVRPARPTRRTAMLLSLCRTVLEDLRLPGRALGIRVEVEEVATAVAEQADLFETARPDPDALATALTRLQGRWGIGVVVRPAAGDSHRPERAGRWEPVELMSELTRGGAELNGNGGPPSGGRPSLVLRLWPAPQPVDVRIEDGRPGALAVDGAWRVVRELQGPERLSGDWWEDPYRREYYRLRTDAGDLLWVFYDLRERRWFWHGWWD